MIAPQTSEAGFAARQRAVERWRRRSRIVAFWRTVLPASILAIVLAIGGWIVARGLVERPLAELEVSKNIEMKAPRFYGVDGRDRTWVLAAVKAVRDPADEGRVKLESPSFILGAGSVRANEAHWAPDSTEIVMRGDVRMIGGDGARMETQEALIDTRRGTITNSRSPEAGRVEIENNMGAITADDYVIGKNGAVTFRGRVRGVINPK